MSTNQQPTQDGPSTNQATDHPRTLSSTALDSTSLTDAAVDSTPQTDTAPEPTSWVDRCQRQFSRTNTTRLANLTDDANEAMPTGT